MVVITRYTFLLRLIIVVLTRALLLTLCFVLLSRGHVGRFRLVATISYIYGATGRLNEIGNCGLAAFNMDNSELGGWAKFDDVIIATNAQGWVRFDGNFGVEENQIEESRVHSAPNKRLNPEKESERYLARLERKHERTLKGSVKGRAAPKKLSESLKLMAASVQTSYLKQEGAHEDFLSFSENEPMLSNMNLSDGSTVVQRQTTSCLHASCCRSCALL